MRKSFVLWLLLLPLVLQAATPKLPPDKELKALALDSLLAFNKAVQEKSFAKFHEERLSPQFRKEFPIEKFTETFRVFIDKGYDIANIEKAEPIFDSPPAIDGEGLLVLKGHYPTRPNKVTFELTYVYGSSAWKLMGIDVQAKPSVENTGKVPTNKGLKKLALDSLLLFNVAIQTKNFEDFYGHSAKLWQKEVTPEEMLGIFQSFIDKEVDISPIAKAEPTFEGTPAVNEDGLLVMKGFYPTEPSRISFELKYIDEDGSWKLVGINVNVKPTADKKKKKEKLGGLAQKSAFSHAVRSPRYRPCRYRTYPGRALRLPVLQGWLGGHIRPALRHMRRQGRGRLRR